MFRLVRRFSEVTKKGSEQVITVSSQKQKSLDKSGFYSSTDISFDSRDNPTLTKVLASKTISLSDTNIKVTSADIAQTVSKDLLQADLGSVKTYLPHQILIEDVDPSNVPKDKEIIFTSQKAQVHAVGRLVDGSDKHGEGRVESQVFVERASKEYWSWKDYVKLVPLLPVAYFLALYLQAVREHYQVASFYNALDREDHALLLQIKAMPRSVVQTVEDLEEFFPES
mmetsp:Transcript_6668/g.11802  ORF Transcript_6668/g.11802 Transcript_6668/m.11802 type:complete len:226 (+) Transcript_6668:3203-3880(+)